MENCLTCTGRGTASTARQMAKSQDHHNLLDEGTEDESRSQNDLAASFGNFAFDSSSSAGCGSWPSFAYRDSNT